ncbi:MAG: phytanoyl-CoA dioxygenase [Rickettsiales bacterium]|nr:phytanoyl-CoA dioxygenase [Rickettsiales bacterium]|tara:strand:+ start:19240 stop:20082 length:843 start_codon:yes stop_codon:yes gene_type:complete
MAIKNKNFIKYFSHIERDYQINGYVLIKGFFDFNAEIFPIIKRIEGIIKIIAQKEGVLLNSDDFKENYMALLRINRKYGSIVYDAVKQLPEFISLVSSSKTINLIKTILSYDNIAIAYGGLGMRINNPNETDYLAPWHQEYPAQLRSPKGVVLWSPLVNVSEKMGPVEILERSHLDGINPVFVSKGSNANKAYLLNLRNEDKIIAKHKKVAPITEPGDVLLMDFLTVHRSGKNFSNHPLWSMQVRYFSFDEAEGKKINWTGSYNSGHDFSSVYPHFIEEV